MYLCTCNNCGRVFEDTNPGNDSIKYENNTQLSLALDELYDGDCPNCGTDGYLQNDINPLAGGHAKLIFDKLFPDK